VLLDTFTRRTAKYKRNGGCDDNMGLPLFQVCYPGDTETDIEELLDELSVVDVRKERISEDEWFARIILPDNEAERSLEILEDAFSSSDRFRMVILAVEATISRQTLDEDEREETAEEKAEKTRISTEEYTRA
jgi:hypothetical protein